MLVNRQEQDKEFLRLNRIESSDVTWMEWREEDVEKLQTEIALMRRECDLWCAKHITLDKKMQMWKLAAFSGAVLAFFLMIVPVNNRMWPRELPPM